MNKASKTMYYLGYVGILISAFCWGYNKDLFKDS